MASRTASVKVYLAEDSAEIRARIGSLLAGEPIDIVGEGATPQRCIEGILASHPDVVVLDVQLDGGSGLEVLRAVRGVQPGVAFIVFSNNSAPAYRKRYLGEGAACFLDKSTEFEQLAHAVTHAGDRALH
jgi:two-component system response regulator DesR